MADTTGQIRNATASDVARIAEIAGAAYRIYIPRMGVTPAPMVADFAGAVAADTAVVIEHDDRVVGFCVHYSRGDHIHLENVAVDPQFAGKGLGGALIAYVEAFAKASGFSAVELYTNIHMTENHTLYPALGYVETDRRNDDGFDRIFYRKTL